MSTQQQHPDDYFHAEFTFRRASGLLDGVSYQVTTYLLIPTYLLPDLQQWEAERGERDPNGFAAEHAMYKNLLAKGAVLHRTDGPAYIEREKTIHDKHYSRITREQYWENGVLKARPLPDDGIGRLRLPTEPSDFKP